tara:strand:+ start:988 stop:1542 length:555 start_codon:yes stop_codon:yes gene_type:complete
MADTSFLNDVDVGPSASDLEKLAALCKLQIECEVEVSNIELDLINAKKRLNTISQETIPELLLSKGISSIVLENGQKVVVTEQIKCGVPKEPVKLSKLLNWVKGTGGSGLIKEQLTVLEPEKMIKDYLLKQGIPFDNVRSIHYQSLKAHIRALLGLKKGTLPTIAPTDVPAEANLFVYKETKII